MEKAALNDKDFGLQTMQQRIVGTRVSKVAEQFTSLQATAVEKIVQRSPFQIWTPHVFC